MNHKALVFVGLCLASLGMLFTTGCDLQRHMKVGVVDTERIIRENPKYMELSVVLYNEKEQFYSQIPRDVKNMSNADKRALQDKLAKEASERSTKFDKMYRDIMKGLQDDIKDQSEQTAAGKGIDMVIISTPSYPTVLYTSGENITTDILLKMKK